jgi:hypothetical protein
MPPSMKLHVRWMNLMKNQIIQNLQGLEILKEKATRQMTHFCNHLAKQLCTMGSKHLTLGANHMCRK